MGIWRVGSIGEEGREAGGVRAVVRLVGTDRCIGGVMEYQEEN